MKRLYVIFATLTAVLLISCAKIPQWNNGSISTSHGYTIVTNAGLTGKDSITLQVNQNFLIYIRDSVGNTVNAQIDFGNGQILTGGQVPGIYTTNGVYHLVATVQGVSTIKLYLTVIVKFQSTKPFTLVLTGTTQVNDTARILAGTNFSAKVLDQYGNIVIGDWDYGNGIRNPGATLPNINYSAPGKYLVTVTIKTVTPNVVLTAYVVSQNSVPVSNAYTLYINNSAVGSGSTYFATKGSVLNFKVLDINGNMVITSFNFGNGNIVNNVTTTGATYSNVGIFSVTATTNAQSITVSIQVSEVVVNTNDAVAVISSSYAGTTNTITLGLKCSAIYLVNTLQNAQVQAEMPGAPWQSYTLNASDIVTISGLQYFKWTFGCPNGPVKFGWLQGNNWAFTASIYRQSDNLYHLNLNNGAITP